MRQRPRERIRNEYETDLYNSTFYAPLINSVSIGRGSSTPTFTRATNSWEFDNNGRLIVTPSGAMRFGGARLVRNRVQTNSEDFTVAAWTKTNMTIVANASIAPNGTMSMCKWIPTSVTGSHYLNQNDYGVSVGDTCCISVYAKAAENRYVQIRFATGDVAGNPRANFDLVTGTVTVVDAGLTASISPAQNGSYRIQATCVAAETLVIPIVNPITTSLAVRGESYAGDDVSGIYVWGMMFEVVSGQTDTTASEYVSVGVLSSPYHGAGTVSGADGCKWFTVGRDGRAASNLLGYKSEPSRTNNCLFSRDLQGPTYAEVNSTTLAPGWVPSTTGSSLVTNGTFDTDTSYWISGGGGGTNTWSSGKLRITASSSGQGAYQDITGLTVGKTYFLSASITLIAGSAYSTIVYTDNSYTTIHKRCKGTNTGIIFKAVSTSQRIYFLSESAGVTIDVDNVTLKECTCIPERIATGLDQASNFATRLTSSATDATITQLLTAATGTRTMSAYIKRITGTGTISMTRDGGTNWTDITSQLVAGTWVRPSITSDVGANPTIGFKMGTSGDVIEIDCVQDENSAWTTSPIVTTSVAVTRNADVLSYTTAFDVAQGTALCSVRSDVPVNSGTNINALQGENINASLMYWNSATSRSSSLSYDGTLSANATGLDITTNIRKRATRWGSDQRIAADGTLGSSVSFDGSMGTTTTLYVGCASAGSGQLSGYISNVHIWPTALSDSNLQQVTK